MSVARIIALLLLISAAVSADPVSTTPLHEVPSGWAYIPLPSVDSWRGIYHDQNSGALVEFDIGSQVKRSAWHARLVAAPMGDVTSASVGGVEYDVLEVNDLNSGLSRHPTLAEYIPFVAGSRSPRPASRLLIATFYPPATAPPPIIWSFGAVLGDEPQGARVKDLLIGRMRLRLGAPEEGWADLPSRANRAALASLVPGLSLREILARLGGPGAVERTDDVGISLIYTWVETGARIRGTLFLDQAQQLKDAPRLTTVGGGSADSQ